MGNCYSYQFKNYTLENTPKLFGDNKYYHVRVLDVYDGDTITVALKLNNKIYQFKLRLMGIDTPEMKSDNHKINEAAYKARNRLFDLITNITINNTIKRKETEQLLSKKIYMITIKTYGLDMYGRILADLYPYNNISHKSFSEILLNENLAYKYDGKTKLKTDEILVIVK